MRGVSKFDKIKKSFSLTDCVISHPISVFTAIILLYVLYWLIIPRFIGGPKPTTTSIPSEGQHVESPEAYNYPWGRTGVFGDSFGALTCLFSALSFWGALCTLSYQIKQARESQEAVARQQLPLILFMPGNNSFVRFNFASKKKHLVAEIKIGMNEENTSNNAALGLVHCAKILFPKDVSQAIDRGVDTSDFLMPNKGFRRSEDFMIADNVAIRYLLKSLIEHERDDRPVVKFERGYRSFLNAYGRASSAYHVILAHHKQDKPKIQELIDAIECNNITDMDSIVKILGEAREVELALKPIHEAMDSRCCSREEYESFVEKALANNAF